MMYNLNKLNEQMTITHEKLGKGSFGSVYKAICNNNTIAIKCETKEKNDNLTLIKEFKICKKIYTIIHYLQNKKEDSDKGTIIKIFNHIKDNNILLLPNEFNDNSKINVIPEVYSYIECNDYNFLTMELCGDNLETLLEKYYVSKFDKYRIAYKFLFMMSFIHSCGIIHRDIKLSNFVMDKNKQPKMIDVGLAKEYYKYEGNRAILINPYTIKSITGTIRYISLNIHSFNSPTINDDLISLCYCLVVIFTEKNLPWVGHKKDIDKFEIENHTHNNCNCGYHKNKANNALKLNSIAEIKFHTSLEELTHNKYPFIIKWIKYLYSLKPKQMPSYNYLLKCLMNDYNADNEIYNLNIKSIEPIKFIEKI